MDAFNIGPLVAALAFCAIIRAVIWLNSLPTEPDDRTLDEISEDKNF